MGRRRGTYEEQMYREFPEVYARILAGSGEPVYDRAEGGGYVYTFRPVGAADAIDRLTPTPEIAAKALVAAGRLRLTDALTGEEAPVSDALMKAIVASLLENDGE